MSNLGFSAESALKASKSVQFETSQKADSVISFFRNHGFAISQIGHVISKSPWLLSCNPDKAILPKFEFLFSKGASSSDVVMVVTKSPRFLERSLQNHLISAYALLKGLFQSDMTTIARIKLCPQLLAYNESLNNVKLLRDIGVSDSNIAYLIRVRPSMLCSSDLGKAVEEVKQLGFDPSKIAFSLAVAAKKTVAKSRWDEKVDAYKNWGWSEDAFLEAFRRQPYCMLRSTDKINAVMNYWVNQFGWDPLALSKSPVILGMSLEKRIIPRGSVLQFILSKGLRTKAASLGTPFRISEKDFVQKFVKRFKEETPQLLKLYEEKKGMNLQENQKKGAM